MGMHRSGTSLVAKVLEKSGIFMGVIKDHNYEAMHFLSLNQQSLWAAKGSWLEPVVPAKIAWKTMPSKVLFEEHFKLSTRWQKLIYHLKPVKWGWKDPRNTFTLPMWLDQFPGARIIHVTRDVQEIAQSLLNRNKGKGEVFDERLDDLTFNQQLAEKYLAKGRQYQDELGSRYCEISYSQIRDFDKKAIARLEKFTGQNLMSAFKYYVHQRKQNTPSES
ncbi:MAG: sulfotransferase [Owenweeksia sp.]|nr:sulfotransferase [Owenweeksia sp.]